MNLYSPFMSLASVVSAIKGDEDVSARVLLSDQIGQRGDEIRTEALRIIEDANLPNAIADELKFVVTNLQQAPEFICVTYSSGCPDRVSVVSRFVKGGELKEFHTQFNCKPSAW